MAKRKTAASTPKSAAARTTALVFQEGSADFLAETPATVGEITPTGRNNLEEIPEDTKLPFKMLYQLQDFLNDHMTLSKGVQVLVCLYICQIFYLHFTRNNLDEVMYSTLFNILGGVLAMFLSHRSQKKKHELQPEKYLYPKLPEFNTVFSFFVPILLIVLMADHKDSFFQANLALSNFAIKSLHPIAKVVSSFVFYYMYNDDATLELFQFMKVIWVYYSVDFSLGAWNEAHKLDKDGNVVVTTTLSNTEIHFIAMVCVNFLVHLETLPLTAGTTSLYIFRILILSLIMSCALAYPLYELYKWLGSGILPSLLSYLIIVAFCGGFYYATNYQFNLFIEKKEVLHWLYDYVTSSPTRTKLLTTWVATFAGAIPVMFLLAKSNILSLNVRRKVWHFLLVATLTYPIVEDPEFTTLAVLGSVIVFVVFEFLRCTQLTVFGKILHSQLKVFQDEKDTSGPLNLSYIYLLVGAGIPLAYGAAVNDPVSIRSYIGLATLGLGDSAASIIGKKFGNIKWKGEVKTFEGTLAYIVATFAYFFAVDKYVLPEASRVSNWENIFIVSVIAGVVEGTASMNDNILVPAISVIAYEALTRVFPGH